MIRPRVGFDEHNDPLAQTYTINSEHIRRKITKRLKHDATMNSITLSEAYVLGELGKPSQQGADMRDPGRSETHMILPPAQAHMQQPSPSKGTATASDRLVTYHTLNSPNATAQGATEAVLGWEPNKDPIGRLKALMYDNTWKPSIVDAIHTSLSNPSDALRRWPRRAERHTGTAHHATQCKA